MQSSARNRALFTGASVKQSLLIRAESWYDSLVEPNHNRPARVGHRQRGQCLRRFRLADGGRIMSQKPEHEEVVAPDEKRAAASGISRRRVLKVAAGAA